MSLEIRYTEAAYWDTTPCRLVDRYKRAAPVFRKEEFETLVFVRVCGHSSRRHVTTITAVRIQNLIRIYPLPHTVAFPLESEFESPTRWPPNKNKVQSTETTSK